MRDTVACLHRGINTIHIDHAIAVIQGHIDTPEMAILLEDPRRYLVKFLIGPVTDELLRQIHMHFTRSPAGPGADTA